MTWITPPQRLDPRRVEEVETVAEAVYAEICEAEEAADRRHDFSDHLGPYGQWLIWSELEHGRLQGLEQASTSPTAMPDTPVSVNDDSES